MFQSRGGLFRDAGDKAGNCGWPLEMNRMLGFGDYKTWSSVRESCQAMVLLKV